MLIVVSAPSGAGKSTLVHRAVSTMDNLRFSVSATTRAAREGETDGVDYHFISAERFAQMRAAGEFLECAEVHGNLYGTPRTEISRATAEGDDVILDIDVQGAEQIKSQGADPILVFVLPPSMDALVTRLESRNANQSADIARRLRGAAGEVHRFNHFDYVIINDDLERAVAELEAIITAERQRAARQVEIAHSIITTFGGTSANV